MSNGVLFAICTLIWGSTWIAITYQIGHTAETLAVAWRYTLAALCLGLFCMVRGLPFKLPLHIHIKMAGVGFFLYCLNYTLLYLSLIHI